MIIGNAGGGKSTLACALSKAHDLPLTELDTLIWKPGWTPVSEAEFRPRHEQAMAGARWVIDGYGPWWSVLDRLQAADTIILIDLPFPIHMWRVLKRQAASLFSSTHDGPAGCPRWRVTFKLLPMMWKLHRTSRPKLLEAIEQQRGHARIIKLTTPDQLDRALNKIQNIQTAT
ncbi:MAG: ATPase AAA [Alphaproteobacteria bacterium]